MGHLIETTKTLKRNSIKKHLAHGLVGASSCKAPSRLRARNRRKRLTLGLQKGNGSKKGSRNAIRNRSYISRMKLVSMRRLLKNMRDRKIVNKTLYRIMYIKSKGAVIKVKW